MLKAKNQAVKHSTAAPSQQNRNETGIALGRVAAYIWKKTHRTKHLANCNIGRRILERGYSVRRQDWAFACPCGIGDTYLACAFARAVLEAYGGDSVTVFTKPTHQFIGTLFSSVARSIVSPSPWDAKELGSYEFKKGQVFRAHFMPTRLSALIGFKGVTLTDCYRAVFGLPWDAEIEKPAQPDSKSIADVEAALRARGLVPGKTVVLCPDARSSPLLASELWNKLALALIEQGWTPITNMGPGTVCIPETVGLEIPLDQFRAYALAAGWFISNRSGLCDLISDLDIPQTILFPQKQWYGGPLIASSSLRAMGLSQHAHESEVDPNAYPQLLESILENAGRI